MSHYYVEMKHPSGTQSCRVPAKNLEQAVVNATAIFMDRGVSYTHLKESEWSVRK